MSGNNSSNSNTDSRSRNVYKTMLSDKDRQNTTSLNLDKLLAMRAAEEASLKRSAKRKNGVRTTRANVLLNWIFQLLAACLLMMSAVFRSGESDTISFGDILQLCSGLCWAMALVSQLNEVLEKMNE